MTPSSRLPRPADGRNLPVLTELAFGSVQRSHALRLGRELADATLSFFVAHEARHLERVRAHLLALVDARPAPALSQNLRSAHTLLGRFGADFNRAFHQALAQEFAVGLAHAMPTPATAAQVTVQPGDPGGELDGMSLSLIDIDEVERILLLDRVAQRFDAGFEEPLQALTQRLSVLFDGESATGTVNPFRPLPLLRAFHSAWEACELDAAACEDLVQSLDPAHSFDLLALYGDLNAILARAGVPARHAPRVIRSAEGSVSAPAPLPETPDPVNPSGPTPLLAVDSNGFTASSFGPRSAWSALAPARKIIAAGARQFLKRLGLGGDQRVDGRVDPSDRSPSDNPDSELHTQPLFSTADPALMGYLGGLQSDASAGPAWRFADATDPSDVNVLRQMRNREEIRAAPELDRGTVDALAEVFDYVFADQAIATPLKVVIGRLQIPVLKAAMIDRDFFLSDQHPARRLVDTLASAALAWAPDKGPVDALYAHIEHTVQRVLNEFKDDLALFVELRHGVSEFLRTAEQQAQLHLEPAVQHAHRGEAWEQAMAQVDEVLHERLRTLQIERPIAPFLVPFLATQWREVLAFALLDAEANPQAYEQALTTLEQLVTSVQPKMKNLQRRALVGLLPDLVARVNTGLDAIGWSGEPRATFTRRLIATHQLAIRMTKEPTMDTGASELIAREGQTAMVALEARRAARHSLSDDEFDDQAKALQRGLWFDHEVEKATRTRCRLSWVSPRRTRLLFTNREGFDAFVRSEREVAGMLRVGQLRPLDQQPIVARALEQLMADDELSLAA